MSHGPFLLLFSPGFVRRPLPFAGRNRLEPVLWELLKEEDFKSTPRCFVLFFRLLNSSGETGSHNNNQRQHVLSPYPTPGIILNVVRAVLVWILTTRENDWSYFSHFIGEETKSWSNYLLIVVQPVGGGAGFPVSREHWVCPTLPAYLVLKTLVHKEVGEASSLLLPTPGATL